MMWFIFSEVMFFAAFFGALFYARELSVPWLGGEGNGALTNYFLWRGYTPAWPTNGPARHRRRLPDHDARGACPLLNTLILLSSGVTITIAHHALRAGHRKQLLVLLALHHPARLHLPLVPGARVRRGLHAAQPDPGSGIYGSTFFMLTGFHGLHVTLGAIMLRDLAALRQGPFHQGPPLRLRGGGLVLALRRRGVAGAVPVRVRAVSVTGIRARA